MKIGLALSSRPEPMQRRSPSAIENFKFSISNFQLSWLSANRWSWRAPRSPSPLNGERAGVRGETNLSRPPLKQCVNERSSLWRRLATTLLAYAALAFLSFASNPALAAEEPIPALRPPRAELRLSFWQQHGWWVAVAAIIVLGAIAVWLRWRQRSTPVPVTPPDVLARSALEALRGRPEDIALVAEVSGIFRHYVIAAFNLPPDELTTAELHRALQSHPQASAELVAEIIEFLSRCDEYKFAPAHPASPFGAVTGALELIAKTEAQRKQAQQVLQPQP